MTTSAKSKKSSAPLSGLYLLCAELLHREVDSNFLQVLRQNEVLEMFDNLEPGCEAYLQRDWSDADFEQAAVDFCDLFILSENDTAPRAAAWLDPGGELSPEAVDAVVGTFILEWKIEVPPSYQHLTHDHLALILYVAVVVREQDAGLADTFEESVLDPWLGKFGEVIAQCDFPIYRALGKVLIEMKR